MNKKESRKTFFLDDLDADDNGALKETIKYEQSLIRTYRALNAVSYFVYASLLTLSAFIVFVSNKMPKPIYVLGAYLMVYLVTAFLFKKEKTHRFTLESMRQKYGFTYSDYLGRFCSNIAIFPLLLLLQYSFKRNDILAGSIWHYTPLYIIAGIIVIYCFVIFSIREYTHPQ